MRKNKKSLKKVLVTGGAGFIGSNLVDELIRLGYRVTVLDNLSSGEKSYLNKKAKFFRADIRNLDKIEPFFRGIDIVFHVAAKARIIPSIIDPVSAFDNNVFGTLNVLSAARDAGVRRVVYSASSSVYGDQKVFPLSENMRPDFKNPYSLSKYIGEELGRLFYSLYGLETVSLRYFNVYGRRQPTSGSYATVIGIFLGQMKAKKPLTIVGDGTMRRDFTHVSDVVRANILAAKSKKIGNGEVINIGAGHNYSINELAEILLAGNPKHRLSPLAAYAKQKPPAFIRIPTRPGEAKETLADYRKAKLLIGWEPRVSLLDGIEELKKSLLG